MPNPPNPRQRALSALFFRRYADVFGEKPAVVTGGYAGTHAFKTRRRKKMIYQVYSSLGFGLLASGYALLVVLVAHVVGFNHLEDD